MQLIKINFLKKIGKIFLILSICLLLNNCVSTINKRINENPVVFSDLKASDRNLVRDGKIRVGMSKKAVYLSLGKPVRKKINHKKNKKIETWFYSKLEPQYQQNFTMGIGLGHYRSVFPYGYYDHHHPLHKRYHYPYDYFSYSPSINYISKLAKKVIFVNNVVSSWEESH